MTVSRATSGVRRGRPVTVVAVMAVGVFLAGFDQTFVVTILPDIMSDLGLAVDEFGRTAWIVNGYLLGYAVVMPVVGRLADRYGRVRLYVVAVVVYSVGSIGVALAPDLTTLTVARAVQAVGGGGVLPVSLAIVADVVSDERRPVALGWVAALDDVGSLLGPLWAAGLIGTIGWRGLFWLNVPLQLPFLWLVTWFVVDRLDAAEQRPVDLRGATSLALAVGGVTLALTVGVERGTGVAVAAVATVVGLGAAVAFVRRQRRAAHPLIDPTPFRLPSVRSGLALYALDGALTITALVLLPLLATTVWELDTLDSALVLGRMLVWLPVGAVLGGLTSRWLGRRRTGLVAFGSVAASFAAVASWDGRPSEPVLLLVTAVMGLGIGLNDAPILSTVVDGVAVGARATFLAVTQTVQTIGMIVGAALLATRGLGRFEARAAELFDELGLDAGEAEYLDLLDRTFTEVATVAALVAAAAAVLAVTALPPRERTPAAQSSAAGR